MARESPRKEFWTTKVRSDESDTLCWKSLGYAIVVQAAEDYREILYRLKKDPTDPMNTDRAVELERFFHSTWYESLCPLDGDYLINALHREVYQLTAKEFLNQPCKINKQISKKLQQLKSLREMATSTTGSMSEMPHSPSSDLQRIESVMARIVDLENEIERDNEALQDARIAVANAIAKLDDGTHIRVMTKRYIELKEWKKVGQELGVGERCVLQQHRSALRQFESLYT